MPQAIRIVFGLIGLGLIIYIVILGVAAAFDWINPGGGSGRVARVAVGTFIGLGATLAIIAYRRFWR